MSIDKSLKLKSKLARPRNVYSKVERIKMLRDEGKWDPSQSVYGIPKVKVLKLKRKGKTKKKAAAETGTGAGTEAKPTETAQKK
jgi:small basic protein (TIGR04137 family)